MAKVKKAAEPVKVRLKKNDLVEVTTGKDQGKTGKVLKVFREKNQVLIEKVNIIKRHTRPSPTSGQGGIVEKEAPIHVSNLMIICNKCGKQTRVAHKTLTDGHKVRLCKKCGEILDKEK